MKKTSKQSSSEISTEQINGPISKPNAHPSEENEWNADSNAPARQIVEFEECVAFLNEHGKKTYGKAFVVDAIDYEVIYKVLVYTIKDVRGAYRYNLDLNKGILLTGPVGCGKTALMKLINCMLPPSERHLIKECREISYEVLDPSLPPPPKYTYQSFQNRMGEKIPRIWCFDDLGTESTRKQYGNECNVMAEILLSRYDLFMNSGMKTHVTTNLAVGELEEFYGNRVRSRMREMFNLISFDKRSRDKRV